jgi:hypothetical protein
MQVHAACLAVPGTVLYRTLSVNISVQPNDKVRSYSCSEHVLLVHIFFDNTLSATPKLKWKTKEPLDMFIVSFHRNTDINKIFKIKTICRAAVTVESIRSNKLIPQCKICQSFGHTRNCFNKHQNVSNALDHN